MSNWIPPPHLQAQTKAYNSLCYNCKRLRHDHVGQELKCPFGPGRFVIAAQFIKRDIDGQYGGPTIDWWACGNCGKTNHNSPAKEIEPCQYCSADNRVVPNR